MADMSDEEQRLAARIAEVRRLAFYNGGLSLENIEWLLARLDEARKDSAPQAWMILTVDGLRHSVRMSQLRAEGDAKWLNESLNQGAPFRVVPLFERAAGPTGETT